MDPEVTKGKDAERLVRQFKADANEVTGTSMLLTPPLAIFKTDFTSEMEAVMQAQFTREVEHIAEMVFLREPTGGFAVAFEIRWVDPRATLKLWIPVKQYQVELMTVAATKMIGLAPTGNLELQDGLPKIIAVMQLPVDGLGAVIAKVTKTT